MQGNCSLIFTESKDPYITLDSRKRENNHLFLEIDDHGPGVP